MNKFVFGHNKNFIQTDEIHQLKFFRLTQDIHGISSNDPKVHVQADI